MLRKILCLGTLVTVVSLAFTAQAAIVVDLDEPVDQRPSFNLNEVNENGGIIVGDKLFSNFRVTTTVQGGGLAPEAEGIEVTGVFIQGELGLRFNGGWSAQGPQIADSTIKFKVSILEPELSNGFLISDNSLFMTAFGAANGGLASISENVYAKNPDVFPPGEEFDNVSIANKFVFHVNDQFSDTYDHREYDEFLPSVWIVKDVIVNGGANQSGVAHISEFYQTFSQIPEPASIMLVAMGSMLMFRRRR